MNNELQHWGIKGQKWGVRRFQNEDGSLTDEGKARYMYAARHNKLDYKKLSDKDLDMINNRFNKENIYKRNVENAMANSPSTKAKKAAIKAAKTLATGTKSGASWVGVLLGTPIKKAFEDALKFDANKVGGSDEKKKSAEEEWYEKTKKQRSFIKGYDPKPDKFAADVKRGQDAFWKGMDDWKNQSHNTSNRSSEDVLRGRSKNKKPDSQADSRPRNLLGLPSGGIHMDPDEYSIHSELMHFGIKGQKWGVRRFQNEDRALTKTDKE